MPDRIRVEDLQDGDMLLYRGTAWLSKAIQYFDGSPVNHVAVYLGGDRVGEAVMEGVVARDVRTSLSGYEWVKAFRLATLPDDMGPVVARADQIVAEGHRYGFEQLLILALLCTTRKLKITPVLRPLLRAVLDAAARRLTDMFSTGKEPMICSEFGYRAYDEADPAADDAYSIEIPGMQFPSDDAEAEPVGPMAAVRHPGVHPESLAALFVTPASTAWIEPAEGGPLADDVQPPDPATLDGLIEAYLQEAEGGLQADAYEEVSLEELRAATDRFAISLHRAATRPEQPPAADDLLDTAAERLAAYQHLFRAAADFVTPADLYTSPSLSAAGVVDL